MVKIKILKAEEKDTLEIVDLLNETALFLLNKNIRQWKYPFDDGPIRKQVKDNEVYLIRVDHELSGTFSIKTADYDWPAGQSTGSDTVYFYRYSLKDGSKNSFS